MRKEITHQLTDETYADLCFRASKYEDLKAELEQIRAEIEERVKPLIWKQKCVNDILEIIDKAIKEQTNEVS